VHGIEATTWITSRQAGITPREPGRWGGRGLPRASAATGCCTAASTPAGAARCSTARSCFSAEPDAMRVEVVRLASAM